MSKNVRLVLLLVFRIFFQFSFPSNTVKLRFCNFFPEAMRLLHQEFSLKRNQELISACGEWRSIPDVQREFNFHLFGFLGRNVVYIVTSKKLSNCKIIPWLPAFLPPTQYQNSNSEALWSMTHHKKFFQWKIHCVLVGLSCDKKKKTCHSANIIKWEFMLLLFHHCLICLCLMFKWNLICYWNLIFLCRSFLLGFTRFGFDTWEEWGGNIWWWLSTRVFRGHP